MKERKIENFMQERIKSGTLSSDDKPKQEKCMVSYADGSMSLLLSYLKSVNHGDCLSS